MKIGLQIPDFTSPAGPSRLGADLAAVARTADQAGFDFLAVMLLLVQAARKPLTCIGAVICVIVRPSVPSPFRQGSPDGA